MGTIITFTADDLVVVITGDEVYTGCTYDVLQGWYGVDNVDLSLVPRPNAPGAFSPEQTYPGEKAISVEGQYFGASRADALLMRETLSALYNDGRPVLMSVADDLRTTSREVLVASVGLPWTIHQEFDFTIDATADDPRRYAAVETVSTGLAQAGTGLIWPVSWPVSWGTAGVDGRVTVANPGNTETVSEYTVDGGEMPDGFVIINVDTGERLTYLGPVLPGGSVVLDTMTRSAVINGTGPGSRYLASPEWWAVPKRSSVTLQFLALGATTGTPTLTVKTRPAYL